MCKVVWIKSIDIGQFPKVNLGSADWNDSAYKHTFDYLLDLTAKMARRTQPRMLAPTLYKKRLVFKQYHIWGEGTALSPWRKWTLWPVKINGQAGERAADMCLCFQPSLLRLISPPAATVEAPVPHSPQHPGLDQSTMWLWPGARRARDRQTDGREGEGKDVKKGCKMTQIYNHFIFHPICQIWWLELFIKALFYRISKASLKTLLIINEPWGWCGVKTMSPPPTTPICPF